jgi:hypothetical protein
VPSQDISALARPLRSCRATGQSLAAFNAVWSPGGAVMNNVIYLVGLVVVVLAVLAFFGLR